MASYNAIPDSILSIHDCPNLRDNSIGTCRTPVEIHRTDQPNYISLRHRSSTVADQLHEIAAEYNIQDSMAERLRKLQDYEIVIVCDDSGSMKETVDGTERSRWDELCYIVKIVLKIGVLFDSNGVDLYFLNRESYSKIKDPKQVDEAFASPPSGYTPLVPVLEQIFESPLSLPQRDKKLLVFIATDGEPTDEDGISQVSELEHLMREQRKVDTTFVSFLICTDDPNCVNYLNRWDQTMTNVDVTDDFRTEIEKIRRYRGQDFNFSYGDYVVKALIGAIDREIDVINEPTMN